MSKRKAPETEVELNELENEQPAVKEDPEDLKEIEIIKDPIEIEKPVDIPNKIPLGMRSLGLVPPENDHTIKTWLWVSQASMSNGMGGGDIIENESVAEIAIPGNATSRVDSLLVSIKAVQEGSGDPAPDNVRPITGWSEVNIYVADEYDPAEDPQVTIDLGGTCYGGILDVIHGKLAITNVHVDLGTLSWSYSDAYGYMYSGSLTDAALCADDVIPNMISSYLPFVAFNDRVLPGPHFAFYSSTKLLMCMHTEYTSAADFTTAVTGQDLVYELAEPFAVDVTPEQIALLTGDNNIWCDTGEILRFAYSYENNY